MGFQRNNIRGRSLTYDDQFLGEPLFKVKDHPLFDIFEISLKKKLKENLFIFNNFLETRCFFSLHFLG